MNSGLPLHLTVTVDPSGIVPKSTSMLARASTSAEGAMVARRSKTPFFIAVAYPDKFQCQINRTSKKSNVWIKFLPALAEPITKYEKTFDETSEAGDL
jgi:hypothetical protein